MGGFDECKLTLYSSVASISLIDKAAVSVFILIELCLPTPCGAKPLPFSCQSAASAWADVRGR